MRFKSYRFNDSRIDSTVFIPLDESGRETHWRVEAEKTFLAALEEEFSEFSLEIFASYGGQRTVVAFALKAKRRGIKSVFMLHSLSYRDPKLLIITGVNIVKQRNGATCL